MDRRRFTAEFQREAVKLGIQPTVSKAKVAEELGIHASVLTRWVRKPPKGLLRRILLPLLSFRL